MVHGGKGASSGQLVDTIGEFAEQHVVHANVGSQLVETSGDSVPEQQVVDSNVGKAGKARVLTTAQIYAKIAAGTAFKTSAVKQIVEQFMDMSFEQARLSSGSFEMAYRMKIDVVHTPAEPGQERVSPRSNRVTWRRAKPAKTTVKVSPMAHMKRKILS